MSGTDSRQQVWDVFAKAIETFDQKNQDYGDAWRTNGWRGNLSRVFEKVQRVRNLAWRPDPRVPAVGDEQVLETLQDLLNTTAFAIINMIEEVEYGHETPRSQRIAALGVDYIPGAGVSFFNEVGDQIPYREEFSHGHGEAVRTEVISHEDVRAAVNGDGTLPVGPDEVRPTEAEGSGRVKRVARGTRVVSDNPQA